METHKGLSSDSALGDDDGEPDGAAGDALRIGTVLAPLCPGLGAIEILCAPIVKLRSRATASLVDGIRRVGAERFLY